jgi:imidazolonepropionase
MVGVETATILIRGARQLVTLRGPKEPRRGIHLEELGIIPDGALLIRDGVIEEVGPTRRVENLAQARGAVEVSAIGRVVMPGFVDCHTHLAFPSPGAAASDAESAQRAIRTGTGRLLKARLRTHLEAMARHGTTTVEVKSGGSADQRVETKILRVLAALKEAPIDVVPSVLLRLPANGAGEAAELEACAEFLPRIRRRGLARFADLALDPEPACEERFRRYLETASLLGFPCKLHAHGAGGSAVRLALEHPMASIDHLEHAGAEEVAALAASSAVATLMPFTSFRSGTAAPARALIDAGAAIALASNFNPQHSPTLNMQTVVALACLCLDMTPGEAISGATINGAYALGCAGRVGSLELGKSADLVMLNISDYHEIADHIGTNLVYGSMKRGEFIYEEGAVAPRTPWDARRHPEQ